MSRRQRYTLVPDRPFIATVTYRNGQQITTTVHGPNATEAEERYLREDVGKGDWTVTRVIVRAEGWR
jgi:hypothetical protein